MSDDVNDLMSSFEAATQMEFFFFQDKVGFHKPFVEPSRSHRPGSHAFQAVGPSSVAMNVPPSRQSSFQPKIDSSEIFSGYRKPGGIVAQHSSVHPPGLLTTVVPHRSGNFLYSLLSISLRQLNS